MGDGTSDPAYVSRLRADSGLAVRFLGRLSREQVWETLSQVDVVALPALWYETFSFIVSEAFTAGLPVIASRLARLAHRVRHDVDGLLLPPGDVAAWRDALQRLVETPGLCNQLAAGIQPQLTLQGHVARLEAIYGVALG